ncbi:MAG: oligosaccharide flippase family protein [Thermoleophilaceae bacterium]|nr:oligosaccharide flippase family protein [Thermoleophilaceae bacterium]
MNSESAPVRADDNIGKRIVGGGVWRAVGYGFATILGVASTSVISRSIGPEDFGHFATAMSLVTVALGISDFGLLALGVREYAALEGKARDRAFRALITLRLLFSFVAGTMIVLFGFAADYSTALIVGLFFAALAIPTQSLQSSYAVPLQATYDLNALAALDVIRQALWSTLLIAAAVVTGNVGVIIATMLPVSIVIAFAFGVRARRLAPLKPAWDPQAMRTLFADVGTFAVAASIGTMYPFLAQIVSARVLTEYDAGQFALAFRIYAVLLGGWMVAAGGAFPLLVTSSKDDIQRMVYAIRRLMQTAVAAGLACTVALVTGATFVSAVLGGDKYVEATDLIALISLAFPATFVLGTGSFVLLASGRHRELVRITLIGATVSVIATWFAATEWGASGAALGIVFGEALIASGYLFVTAQIDREALPKLSWFVSALVAGGLGCAVALLHLPGLIAAILGTAVYVIAGLFLRVFPPELTDRIPLLGPRLSGG